MINNYNPSPEYPVLGRELHAALGVKTPYMKWFTRNGSSKFLEWFDYLILEEDSKNAGQRRVNHQLTTVMAAEISRRTPKAVTTKKAKELVSAPKASIKTISSELVQITVGEPRVSSLDIAKYSEVQHKNVMELVGAHTESLESFGTVAFQTRPLDKGGIPLRYAMLNEPQATLLITFMRNTKKVIEFKRELVRQFYEMKEALWALSSPIKEEPKPLAERAKEVIQELSLELEQKVKVIEEQTPLVVQAKAFNTAHGNVGKQEFAQSVASTFAQDGVTINVFHIYTFMADNLNLFVSKGRKHAGQATTTAVRDGYAVTRSGTNDITGRAWTQGMLTPKGVEYVWKRIHKHLNQGKSLDQH